MPNSDLRYIGVTQISVATSAIYNVQMPGRVQACWLTHNSGGTLFMVSAGASNTQGAVMQHLVRHEIPGPANFYLGAIGAAATVGLQFQYTCGVTLAQNPNNTNLGA